MESDNKGIIHRVIEDLFQKSLENISIKITYFEIYNDLIIDLLDESKYST